MNGILNFFVEKEVMKAVKHLFMVKFIVELRMYLHIFS
jgi:hypothetical protein